MRILLLLLIAGLCLVTAKYIPIESSDTNLVLNRVRRSDSDSDTASVERDDDSSNDNDKDDGDDKDKKYEEEQVKLREKEEKKKQKHLEKLEKEKQKEIEEKRKLEEKLAKEKRKEEERKEKEERKLAEKVEKENRKREEEERKTVEKIEKENRKREEEERKAVEKLEKEERKRQEKLKKQLEKIHEEQINSAEDTYLETEEEDSVEMEDIWKAHVYDKYGLSITSTKLERQAALQRYLQEEMGINANSTKSERRQAILILIQTKLQNDSAAVESFKNLLISHVNAVQIQKLRTKLEKDLEELDNQTALLNNISLPWASSAQQNIEEKRTFLQVVSQFLSNIVPNWFAGSQSSSSTNLISKGENNLNVLPNNVDSGLSSSNPSNVEGPLFNTTNVRSQTPLGPELSTKLTGDGNSLNNNAPLSEPQTNGISSKTGNSVSTDLSNGPVPSGSGDFISGSTGLSSEVSKSVNNNISLGEIDTVNNATTFSNVGNSESSNTILSTNSGFSSSNHSELNGSSFPAVDANTVKQSNDNGINLNIVNNANSDSASESGSEFTESTLINQSEVSGSLSESASINSIKNGNNPISKDVNGLVSSAPDLVNVNITPGPKISAINPAEPNLPGETGFSYTGTPETSKTSLNSGNSDNSNSLSISELSQSAIQTSNPSELGGVSVNTNTPADQSASKGLLSNTGNTSDSDSLNTSVLLIIGSELTKRNSLEPNRSTSSLNDASVSQNDSNGLALNTNNPVNADASTTQSDLVISASNPSNSNLQESSDSLNNTVAAPEPNTSELSAGNPSESVLNNNAPAGQSGINEKSSTSDDAANLNSSNKVTNISEGSNGNQIVNNAITDVSSTNNKIPDSQTVNSDSINLSNSKSTVDFVSATSNISDVDVTAGSDSINSNVSTGVEGLNADTGNSATSDLSSIAPSTVLGSNADVLVQPNDVVDSSVNKVSSVNNISELPSNMDSSANVDSSNVSSPRAPKPSLENPSNDGTAITVSLSNNSSPQNNVANGQKDLSSLPESSNGILSTVSDQIVDTLSPSVVDDSTRVDNTISVSSSTTDNQNGIVLDSERNATDLSISGNGNNVPKETVLSANNINEVARDSNVAPLNDNAAAQANDDLNPKITAVSTNEKNELTGSTASPVEDILNLTGTESIPSNSETTNLLPVTATENTNTNLPIVSEGSLDSATVLSVVNSNTNEVLDSVTIGSVDLNDSASRLEVTNGIVPLSPDTVLADITTNNQTVNNSMSQDPTLINIESTTDNVGDNVITNDQNVDSLTTSVTEINGIEARTEQDFTGVEEIMNTPNDLVTVTSVQPTEAVNIPDEAAATVVDVKLQ